MKYDPSNQDYIFSTGRVINAHYGVIGIDPVSEDIYEGFIDYIKTYNDSLTKEEQLELCDYMIDLWKKRKEKCQS